LYASIGAVYNVLSTVVFGSRSIQQVTQELAMSCSPRRWVCPLLVSFSFLPLGAAFGQPRHIAYVVPAGTAGNQAFGGALGMDFNVELDILVTRLGVFDSGSDGLMLPIVAKLYNREDFTELASILFTPEDQGELVGGSRFKDLDDPLDLPAGFQGTIVAGGYGAAEMNGNQGAVDLGLTTDDGKCSISFVGGGRFGNDPNSFPGTPDGGPANRYGAGTFEFIPQEELTPRGADPAILVPEGTAGNQAFGGVLGMDFNVNTWIAVTRLGVFDSGSDGLNLPITARLFNRENQEALATLLFTPEDPGDPEEGSLFKDLDPPLVLGPGFRGTIAASGYGDEEMNGNAAVFDLALSADNGGCAISFQSGGRFGADPAGFPSSRDAGPFPRYAAGTFSFRLTDPPPDPPPATPRGLMLAGGNGQVQLSWEASEGEPPAVSYKVLRAGSPGGPFVEVAQVAETTYTDAGLPNDVEVCYRVRGVSATGKESPDSLGRCATPTAGLPEGRFIAYEVPAGAAGNQEFGGTLGMDFDVISDIRILRIGVFDDLSDGLNRTIQARLYDRDDISTPLVSLEFTPAEPGRLFGGSRFQALDDPIELPAGFRGTIVAEGYGPGERNGNQGGGLRGYTTNDGDCRISFVGGGRFGNEPGGYPGTVDGGPANRYGAGTFDFEGSGGPPLLPLPPPTGVRVSSEERSIRLRWTPPPAQRCILPVTGYKVLRSSAGGPLTEVAQVSEPEYADNAVQSGVSYCYEIRSLGAGGRESAGSAAVCATPGRVIAYQVPGGTQGNQAFGGALGMDFDVLLDIRVTRLGVFDDGGDGLAGVITCRLYDRDTQLEITSIEFTPEDPGTLLGGSRFKPVDFLIDLPAGFRGTIVAEGYSDLERNGNGGAWTTNSGPCSIYFTGRGRFGDPGEFPFGIDQGRPDQYAAGTFEFAPAETATPRGAIAYNAPEGTFGNQNFTGALGMDFDVNTAIRVVRLGVFDSGSDGLNATITARLHDRRSEEVLASLVFTPDDPGDLEEGSRFKDLEPPLVLPAGFEGTIVGQGYGDLELNGNQGGADLGLLFDSGGCAISFIGGGRFGAPGVVEFPRIVDGGPVNRYAAGTFQFELADVAAPRFVRGDADSDGTISLTDAVRVLSFLFLSGAAPACMDAADADDSGGAQLSITDAIRILGWLFTGGADPPPPTPSAPAYPPSDCGVDPTPDEFGCAQPSAKCRA
jgi:hypothetical protein